MICNGTQQGVVFFFELRLFEFILYQQNYVTLSRTSDKLFVSK